MLEEDGVLVGEAPADDGDGAPRQTYNFAPSYDGIVYRADTPELGANFQPVLNTDDSHIIHRQHHVRYKLQTMRWGLVPSWTRQTLGYSLPRMPINCRGDSLSLPGGIWATMKSRQRCLVIAQGYYEWLRKGPKHNIPHYVTRTDGHLMCFAGLWDCAKSAGKSLTVIIINSAYEH